MEKQSKLYKEVRKHIEVVETEPSGIVTDEMALYLFNRGLVRNLTISSFESEKMSPDKHHSVVFRADEEGVDIVLLLPPQKCSKGLVVVRALLRSVPLLIIGGALALCIEHLSGIF